MPEQAELYNVLTPMEVLTLTGQLHDMELRQIEIRARRMLGFFGPEDHKVRNPAAGIVGMLIFATVLEALHYLALTYAPARLIPALPPATTGFLLFSETISAARMESGGDLKHVR